MERPPEVTGFRYPLLAERGYPLTAAVLADGEHPDSPTGPDIEFDLTRILDGIERLVRPHTADDQGHN